MDFPAWMYHAEHAPRIFESAEELADAGKGWTDAPVATESTEQTDETLDRDALKARATDLGITFPANIKTDKLAALVAEAGK